VTTFYHVSVVSLGPMPVRPSSISMSQIIVSLGADSHHFTTVTTVFFCYVCKGPDNYGIFSLKASVVINPIKTIYTIPYTT